MVVCALQFKKQGRTMIWQKTLNRSLSFTGVGLHGGKPVTFTINPAPANRGIRFVRADLAESPEIRAHYTKVVDTTRATTLGEGPATLSTVEHLLAALLGLGVDNALVQVGGPELPIMDGSAAPFVKELMAAGLRSLPWPRTFCVIRHPLELRKGNQWMRLTPGEPRITCSIDFPHPLIRHQRYSVSLGADSFRREISPARTFGFLKEVEFLKSQGLARGGSLDNAVVLDDSQVLNPGGFRFPEECVRHKILDALGDLALLGLPILGHLEVSRGSHTLHHRFLEFLVSQEQSWRLWVPSPRPKESQDRFFHPPMWEGVPA
jgi:UDP-3-O-[3-hydroxymyristoyl] N-acetylglucosamine deacetylase